jgi:pimeloyl-ACP methyl ester carboxylesterase
VRETLQLDCRGVRVAAHRLRRGARRVLALHGWLDNANSFVPLAPTLENCELVAVDLPGHGGSGHRAPQAHYLFLEWVADVLAIAGALGWDRFTLLGHSMGGGIGSLVAALYPERVNVLLLLDGLGWISTPEQRLADVYLEHQRQIPRLAQRQLSRGRPAASLVDALCRVVPGLDPASAALLVQGGTVPTGDPAGTVRWSADPRLRIPAVFGPSQAQVLALLGRIACPSLLVRPHQGFAFRPTEMAEQCAAVRGLQQIGLAGGHHVHMQAPAAVGEILINFLQQTAAG